METSQIMGWPQKNIHKIFIPKKYYFFWKPQKILKFKNLNPKNDPGLHMQEISEYPPPTWAASLHAKGTKISWTSFFFYFFRDVWAGNSWQYHRVVHSSVWSIHTRGQEGTFHSAETRQKTCENPTEEKTLQHSL